MASSELPIAPSSQQDASEALACDAAPGKPPSQGVAQARGWAGGSRADAGSEPGSACCRPIPPLPPPPPLRALPPPVLQQVAAKHPHSPPAKRLHSGSGGPSAAAAPTSIDALPDEILLLCLAPLPERMAILLEGSARVRLSWRGPCELVCRRWRRLCLSTFPAKAAIQASLHTAPVVEQALSAVRQRRVQDLRLTGAVSVSACLPAAWLPPLTRASAHLFPGLLRLCLERACFPAMAARLPLCERLEALDVGYGCVLHPSKWEEIASTLGALPSLRQLDFSWAANMPASIVASAVGCLPRLDRITLKERNPEHLVWLPHLRQLAVFLSEPGHAEALARALPRLTCLSRLAFVDRFSDEDEQPLQLPELQSLTALVEMQCVGWVPPQVWYCRHLSALTCWDCFLGAAEAALPAPAEMQLGRLQRLQLRDASFAADDEGCLHPQLCIPALTSLLWMESELNGNRSLPPEFSRLSNLRQLAMECCNLDTSAEPLAQLSSLTELNLPYSSGCLPRGPYLSNLEVLGIPDIAAASDGLLPAVLSAAKRLRVLHVDFEDRTFRLADWPRLQAALQRLRSLKVLCCSGLDVDMELLMKEQSVHVYPVMEFSRDAFEKHCQLTDAWNWATQEEF